MLSWVRLLRVRGPGFFVRVEKHLGVGGAVAFQIEGSPPPVDFENHPGPLKRATLFFDADAICVASFVGRLEMFFLSKIMNGDLSSFLRN